MLKSPIPCEKPAMTKTEAKPAAESVNALFSNSPDGLREIVRAVMQEMLETEMTDALGAEKGERSAARLGYRSGYYSRTLVTRVGKLELRVPQDRDGRFSTVLFERYQRSEQALVATLAEMYVQGVSTRKVKAITEELCGHAFSASAISAINKRLDESLEAFAGRPLEEPFAYLILDARYEKVREGGVVTSQAVLIAIGVDWDGRRQILAVEMANRESRSSWKDFLLGLRRRGLNGVEFVVADDHAGLRMAIREVLPEAAPDGLRDQLRSLTRMQLVRTLASWRPDLTAYRDLESAYRIGLKSLARRYLELHDEIADLDAMIAAIVDELAPNLIARNSIGHVGAAQLLLTAGGNPERLRSEASFASLCGVSPVPASSGKTVRHRLNRGGDRAANSALHIIAIGRLRTDQRTKDYVARRIAEGHSKLDAIRALKRYLAREVFTLITQRRREINATQIAA